MPSYIQKINWHEKGKNCLSPAEIKREANEIYLICSSSPNWIRQREKKIVSIHVERDWCRDERTLNGNQLVNATFRPCHVICAAHETYGLPALFSLQTNEDISIFESRVSIRDATFLSPPFVAYNVSFRCELLSSGGWTSVQAI